MEILEKYHRLSPNGKILMSADRICNSGPLLTKYFRQTGSGYDYLCSGGFIGGSKSILLALETIDEVMKRINS